jgi:hypothetical protein
VTKRERKALEKYVRWVADAMELRDWTITIDNDPCADDLEGSAVCTFSQRHVTIAFATNFRDRDPADQRETVVHELLHAHHEVTWRMVQTDLAGALGKPVYYVFCDSYRRAMEYTVDALAKTIAKAMPLIDWGGK